jgi:hypothetical protein
MTKVKIKMEIVIEEIEKALDDENEIIINNKIFNF